MITNIAPERLAQLHAEGRAQALAAGKFIDPHTVAAAERVLNVRGERWAASVLLRDLSRRSRLLPQRPWLENGELETLVLADRAEWELLESAVA